MNSAPPVLPFSRVPGLRAANRNEENCGYCRHFMGGGPDPKNLKAPITGVCRRFPPTPSLAGMQQTPAGPVPMVMPLLVPVNAEYLCGEFSPKRAPS